MGFENLYLDEIDDNFAGLLVEILIFVYCFAGLASVCDRYLVVSLETLCVRWGIREDVAGATFMAFGSAAPEIIINALGTITGESDLGVGAIIGSGMIAFSVIPGLCALVAGTDLMLKRRPLARDSTFYFIALCLLTYFFSDGFITLFEGLTLFLLYIVYVSLVFLSPNIRQYFQKRKREQRYEAALKEAMAQGADRTAIEELKSRYLNEDKKKSFVEQARDKADAAAKAKAAGVSVDSTSLLDGAERANGNAVGVSVSSDSYGDNGLVSNGNPDEDDADYESHHVPEPEEEEEDNSLMARTWRGFTLPLNLAFDYTCVACEHDGPKAKWYPLTFFVAFLWVSFFSFTISAVAGRWNDLSGLPLSLFGIVLVAVGAEIPDTISSLAVARRGYGSMAISNSCGSQITNILFGLGLPWTLANIFALRTPRVPGLNVCENEDGSPIENCDNHGWDEKEETVDWSGVQVADHNDVILAAGFQFFILLTFISSLLVIALWQRKDKATLNKTKGMLLVCTYITAVSGYMIVSRGIVAPAADAQLYPKIGD